MKILSIVFSLVTLLTLTACQSDRSTYPPTLTPSISTPPAVAQNEKTATRTDKFAQSKIENMEVFGATYTNYETNKAVGQKHILFFHASWCPTCVKWEREIKNRIKDLADNTLILKVDYDNQTDLKTKYGITKQSTAVFIDADGSVVKTEPDPSIESLNAFFAN